MWSLYVCGQHCTGGRLRLELQTKLEVVQAYAMRWRIKFNSRKSKIMVVGRRSWKLGVVIMEIMEEVEVFKHLVCGLIGNYEVKSTELLEDKKRCRMVSDEGCVMCDRGGCGSFPLGLWKI